MVELRKLFSVSCGATFLMILYMGTAGLNLYMLMFPLARIDVSSFSDKDFVKSLWSPKADKMHMRVYVSTKAKFTFNLLRSEFEDNEESSVLWDEEIDSPAFSKSFLLTSLECDVCDGERSFDYASDWLSAAEQSAADSGSVFATMTAAGQGIESTSILLTFYQSISQKLVRVLKALSIFGDDSDEKSDQNLAPESLGRSTIRLPSSSPLWAALQQNTTLHLHVVVLRKTESIVWPPSTFEEAADAIRKANSANSLLLGEVGLVKHDAPDHVKRPGRILYHDLLYLFRKYTHIGGTTERPPWDLEFSNPVEYTKFKEAEELRALGSGYPFWKPEVSVKYVNDEERYPLNMAGVSGMPIVQVSRSQDHPTGYAFTPALHVDEIGMTSDKYIPINGTVTCLPLRISFDRSDMESGNAAKTATAGGLSPSRWRLLTHMSQAIESQAQLGFEQSDIDDIRRLVADTNVTLLAVTMLASALHLLFEFLTFKSEVNFWNNNKDLTGLSVRSLFLDMVGQTVILLFLIDKESSLLMTVPSACGCLIALWKCQRAAGLRFVKKSPGRRVSWWNFLPRLLGYELRAVRLEQQRHDMASASKDENAEQRKRRELTTLTMESDQLATRTLGVVLLPLVIIYTLYSLIREEHISWYSWLITSASSAVYALGFVLMTPQLFLNWKLKSVAHLPWRVLVYKSLNTFIDDLFSFIIRMPTMARISCFRDDIVFFIYLYQRWLYPVDTSRPVEGGEDGRELKSSAKTKKE